MQALNRFNIRPADHIVVIDPVPYSDLQYITGKSSFVVTDSGGLQKEAYFHKKSCITLRDETEWGETLSSGWNVLAGSEREAILKAFHSIRHGAADMSEIDFGNGHAGEIILDYVADHFT